jgi:hypothetical protein
MRVTVKALEAYLKDTGTPYVAPDKARWALRVSPDFIRKQGLQSFDFVIYVAKSGNLLVTCKPFTCGEYHAVRDNMARWQELFGQGFRAAEARMKGGEIVFVDLDGREIRLPEPVEAAPVAEDHVADTGKMVAGSQGLLFSPVEVYLTGG